MSPGRPRLTPGYIRSVLDLVGEHIRQEGRRKTAFWLVGKLLGKSARQIKRIWYRER